MAIHPIEAPIALDLTLRESQGGGIRSRRASVPAPAVAAPAAEASESASTPLTEPTQVERHLAPMNLKFSTDEQTGKTIVSLVDTSGNVLRQVPSAEALKVAEAIGKFQGVFLDLKV